MRAIITYHSIDESGSPISVSPAAFERHLRWYASGRVPVVPMAELVRRPSGPPAVALSFDDALETAATWAFPRLIACGLPVTVFVPTGHVGRDNRWAGVAPSGIPVVPVMSWSSLAALAEDGVEIGGHSRSHPRLPGLEVSNMEDEVAGCAEDIRRELGIAPGGFAYPYGALDIRVRSTVARHFDYAVTTDLRCLDRGEDPHQLPRIDAWYLRDSRWLDRWGSPSLRAFLSVRRAGRAIRGWLR